MSVLLIVKLDRDRAKEKKTGRIRSVPSWTLRERALCLIYFLLINQCACQDSPAGTKAGAAAEIAVVGLTTGHPKAALLAAGASLIIEDYNDATLWAKLQRELGESEQEEQVSPGLLVQGPPDLLQLERTDPKQEVVQGIPVAQPEPPLQSSTT